MRGHLARENVDTLVAEVRGKSTRQVQELLARRVPRPDVQTDVRPVATPTPSQPLSLPAAPRPRVEPLSAERYALTLAIGRELLEKLERARDLMMHANPRGDLAVVVERAVDALLAKLEKQRLAKTERPQSNTRPCDPDRVAANVRREVFARDGEQCTYVDEATGERCTQRAFLELDHGRPRARGGPPIRSNLRVRCRAHNRLHAEDCFGRAHVQERIDFRRRKRDPKWDKATDELLRRGLVGMGFRAAEVKNALRTLAECHANDDAPPSKEALLVEALRVLA